MQVDSRISAHAKDAADKSKEQSDPQDAVFKFDTANFSMVGSPKFRVRGFILTQHFQIMDL